MKNTLDALRQLGPYSLAILGTVLTAEQIVVLWPTFRDALTGAGEGLSISTTPPPSGTSN